MTILTNKISKKTFEKLYDTIIKDIKNPKEVAYILAKSLGKDLE